MAHHQRSGSYSHVSAATAPPAHDSADAAFYPQRPNSYFAAGHKSPPPLRSASQASYRNSHEMVPSQRGGSARVAAARASRQGVSGDQHAFGEEGSDSEGSDDGQGFNVYKDFNNKGARYSAAFSSADVYRHDPFASSPTLPPQGQYSRTPTTPDTIEPLRKNGDLVSAPNLGKEWNDAEARGDKRWEGKGSLQTREAWRNRKANAGAQLGAWRRGEKKVGGWFEWKHAVFGVFGLIIALSITLYFVVPRVPLLAYNHDTFMVGDNTTMLFSRTPANFTFDATMNLALDGRNSYIPVHATDITVSVIDLSSSSGTVKVGEGRAGSLMTSPKGYKPLSIPIRFKYSAANASDSTWLTYYNACGHIWPGNSTRPTLLWNVVVKYKVIGLIGSKGDSTTINNVACPIELPTNGA